MTSVALIGGPFKGCRVDLSHTPPRIDVGEHRYERIDDPDTGESLGGYVYQPPTVARAPGGGVLGVQ